jgi:hypothetical protein
MRAKVKNEICAPPDRGPSVSSLAAPRGEKITRGVVRDVQTFSAEREQTDDLSVMAVRWPGPSTAATNPS